MTEENTPVETESTETEEVEEESTDTAVSATYQPDTYHKPEALFRIAIWSGWIGWAFLIVALVNFGLRIYNNYYPLFASGQANAQSVFYLLINEAYSVLFMVFVFLVLQGVSQGSYILMDIFEKLGKS